MMKGFSGLLYCMLLVDFFIADFVLYCNQAWEGFKFFLGFSDQL